MNDTITQVRAWWASLNAKQRKYVRIGLVVAGVVLLALLSNCGG